MDINKLKEFKKLFDEGTISSEEFIRLKKNYIEKYKEHYKNNNSGAQTKLRTNDPVGPKSIEKCLAGTTDFWYEFHKSLKLSYSGWNNFKHYSLDEWIAACWDSPEMLQYLKILYNYPLIKGEFLLSFGYGFLLTNYRLIVNDKNVGEPSIPLTDIKSYFKSNGIIEYLSNGKEIQLQYQQGLNINVVNGAISRNQGGSLSQEERYFLSKNRMQIRHEKPELKLPELDMMPRPSTISKPINEDNGKKLMRVLIIATLIGIAGLVAAFNIRPVSGFMFTLIFIAAGFGVLIVTRVLFWIAEQFNFDTYKFKLTTLILAIYSVFFLGYSGALSYTESSERANRESQQKAIETETKVEDNKPIEWSCNICNRKFTHSGYELTYEGNCQKVDEGRQGFLCSCDCARAARRNLDRAVDEAIQYGKNRRRGY